MLVYLKLYEADSSSYVSNLVSNLSLQPAAIVTATTGLTTALMLIKTSTAHHRGIESIFQSTKDCDRLNLSIS